MGRCRSRSPGAGLRFYVSELGRRPFRVPLRQIGAGAFLVTALRGGVRGAPPVPLPGKAVALKAAVSKPKGTALSRLSSAEQFYLG